MSTDVHNFFTDRLGGKFATERSLKFAPHSRCLLLLLLQSMVKLQQIEDS